MEVRLEPGLRKGIYRILSGAKEPRAKYAAPTKDDGRLANLPPHPDILIVLHKTASIALDLRVWAPKHCSALACASACTGVETSLVHQKSPNILRSAANLRMLQSAGPKKGSNPSLWQRDCAHDVGFLTRRSDMPILHGARKASSLTSGSASRALARACCL